MGNGIIESKEPFWDFPVDTKGRADFAYFVTEDETYCIYYSRMDEYGMMKFISSVQIWTNKTQLKQLFSSGKIKFEFQYNNSCYYLDKSELLVLLSPCSRHSVELVYVLFDFKFNRFTLIVAPDFQLKEISKGVLRLDLVFRYVYDKETQNRMAK